ncbi:hypothetical protein FZEAL_3163 [Fusarium zealandicum]|uniref:Uncharacterized protein n=1 Tax=Fusarium zealandicum TaxID=1053134 RepID=A0A8H4UQ03_9HYPO|nr:hypothetical protein FZEAL_3163 [Fusarium zealandicum]
MNTAAWNVLDTNNLEGLVSFTPSSGDGAALCQGHPARSHLRPSRRGTLILVELQGTTLSYGLQSGRVQDRAAAMLLRKSACSLPAGDAVCVEPWSRLCYHNESLAPGPSPGPELSGRSESWKDSPGTRPQQGASPSSCTHVGDGEYPIAKLSCYGIPLAHWAGPSPRMPFPATASCLSIVSALSQTFIRVHLQLESRSWG